MAILNLALVGGDSLLGREIREVLRGKSLPIDLHLIGADEEETGKVVEEAGEATVITPLDRTHLATADVVVLCGSAESSRKALELAAPTARIVDATRVLEDMPDAVLRAPMILPGAPTRLQVIAHPAAFALAQFFSSIEELKWDTAVVEVLQPASEFGQQGIDELHKQTMRLFAFQSLPQDVFDSQLAYNLLPALGPESPHSLDQIEQLIERHAATLLSSKGITKLPSIRLVQAPVFHGHSLAAWVSFAADPGRDRIIDAVGALIDEDGPTNVNTTGQGAVAVGNIRQDRNLSRAWWFWMAADNLRITADNTVTLVEELSRTA